MTILPFLAVSFIMKIVAAIFLISAVALILIILVQKGRGGGLSAAFGGGAAGGILGSKTGDFLTWVTIVLVGVFLTLAIVMAKYYKPSEDFGVDIPPPVTVPRELPSPTGGTGTPLSGESTDVNLPGLR
jgi:preprotein translocase subunit SecG